MTIHVRQAIGPEETRTYDTARLREQFLIEELFSPGQVRMTYSHLDRTIVGGAVPDGAPLELPTPKPVGCPNFCDRREIGVFCIAGSGSLALDGERIGLAAGDCLYVPKGTGSVVFEGGDAQFYFVSTPAHRSYPMRKIRRDEAIRHDLGEVAEANIRTLRQYIHPDVTGSCQLVMGMTTIASGSTWNTMPCHVHDRRSEVYFYFNLAKATRVFHFMGEPSETRHIVVADRQAVLSPGWSIHCGSGTGPYSFIWSMAGDNQDFTDMDFVEMEDLR
ncbi:5-dehydro-4-deoxy-D-glucuronate isomerase [Sedimentitalea sp. JM2-8]|uniref:4-deoxy-L-threo-5-hexosulose-uronate ketol-isomerase n=1 Tax=Sedimentitalea xiamensis TaxID=3050037 RepID=A0ABT7FGT7_9RHOB|nr:5-dehydro-4-deoxy-D-glucuronate isomerase [Sedimentitalea xiamensis]MDK3074351.1 5-dehydro-4-deoxy-D-glucuronate isomerase [Sedimentitalea xiamensis]